MTREQRLEGALRAAMRDVDVWSVYPPGHPLAGHELNWHKLAMLALQPDEPRHRWEEGRS